MVYFSNQPGESVNEAYVYVSFSLSLCFIVNI